MRPIAAAAGLIAGLFAAAALAQAPAKIRIGHGPGSDLTLLLMVAKPEIAPGMGKSYTVEYENFRGTEPRFKAFLAREIDGATGSGHGVLFAAAQGIDFTVVASISRKSVGRGFNTTYVVAENSPIASTKDVKGKIVGINGFKSSIHLWALAALQKAGLQPERDFRFAVVPFGAQAGAVRSAKLDVAALVQPFYEQESRKGGFRPLFTSKDAMPFDEELQVLFFDPAFLAKNRAAVRAYLADFVAATRYYLDQPRAAREALVKAKQAELEPELFYAMQDFDRDRDGRINLQNLAKMQDAQIGVGFQEKRIDVSKIVDLGYLPR